MSHSFTKRRLPRALRHLLTGGLSLIATVALSAPASPQPGSAVSGSPVPAPPATAPAPAASSETTPVTKATEKTGVPPQSPCESPQFSKFIAMDYKSFDQSPPDGGWRALQDKNRDEEIAQILDAYVQCREGLTGEQKAVLNFHAGQIYAELGQIPTAMARMKLSLNDNLDKKYPWNAYVEGTMAFLQQKRRKLLAARNKALTAKPDHPYVETLSNLLRCFEAPYKDRDQCRKGKTYNPSSASKGTK